MLETGLQERLLKAIDEHLKEKQWFYFLTDAKILLHGIVQNKIPAAEPVIQLLADLLQKLDDTAKDYHYRIFLNDNFVKPLIRWSQDKNQNLSYEISNNILRLDKDTLFHPSMNDCWPPVLNYFEESSLSDFKLDDKNININKYRELATSRICNHCRDHNITKGQNHDLKLSPASETSYVQEQILNFFTVYWRSLSNKTTFFKEQPLLALYQLADYMLNVSDNKAKKYWLILQSLIVNHSEVKLPVHGVMHQTHKYCQDLGSLLKKNISLEEFENVCNTYLVAVEQPLENNKSEIDISSVPILMDHYASLEKTRSVFKDSGKSATDKQKIHSEKIIKFLKKLTGIVMNSFGAPPCGFALCVLGSTSRHDRRPCSDIELMALIEPQESLYEPQQKHIEFYLFHFITLLELLIASLGETGEPNQNNSNNGFHIDSTCHILTKRVWGTPQGIIEQFFNKTEYHESPNQHPWVHSEHLYALITPALIGGTKDAQSLFKKYQEEINSYLNIRVVETDNAVKLFRCLKTGVNEGFISKCERRKAIAVSCLLDVLQKSVLDIKTAVLDNKINIKNTYYKPLAYLAMNLRLYYETAGQSPAEIFSALRERFTYDGENVSLLLQNALDCIAEQQIKLHRAKGFQEEEMLYRKITDEGTGLFWENAQLLEAGIILPLITQLEVWLQSPVGEFADICHSVFLSFIEQRLDFDKLAAGSLFPVTKILVYLPNMFIGRLALLCGIESRSYTDQKNQLMQKKYLDEETVQLLETLAEFSKQKDADIMKIIPVLPFLKECFVAWRDMLNTKKLRAFFVSQFRQQSVPSLIDWLEKQDTELPEVFSHQLIYDWFMSNLLGPLLNDDDNNIILNQLIVALEKIELFEEKNQPVILNFLKKTKAPFEKFYDVLYKELVGLDLNKYPDQQTWRYWFYKWTKAARPDLKEKIETWLDVSDATGFRIKEITDREELQKGLAELSNASNKKNNTNQQTKTKVKIHRSCGGKIETKDLHGDVINEIIRTETGHLNHTVALEQSKEAFEHRNVASIEHNGAQMHFKEHPDFPLMAQASYYFNQRLFGHGVAYSELVIFEVELPNNNKPLFYPVLVSLTAVGGTLQQKLELNRCPRDKEWDLKRLSEMLIMETLKHPADGHFRNYVVEEVSSSPKKSSIVCVDNEQYFGCGFATEGKIIKEEKLKEINGIVTLPEFQHGGRRHKKLSTSALRQFIKQFKNSDDIDRWLKRWLVLLAQKEKETVLLLKKFPLAVAERLSGDHAFTGEMRLPYGVIGKLKLDLCQFLVAIGEEILLSPKKVLTVCSGRSIATKYLPNVTLKPMDLLGKITEQKTQTMRSSDFFNKVYFGGQNNDGNSIEEALNEIGCYQFVTADTVDLNLSKFNRDYVVVLNYEKTTNEKIQREELKRLIKSQYPFNKLFIKNCTVLDDPLLESLLKSSENTLRVLIVSGHKKITKKSLVYLADNCKKLEILIASGTWIEDVSTRGSIILSWPLNVPSLQELRINDCIGLWRFEMNAPELTHLSLNNAVALKTVTFGKKFLPKLQSLNLQKSAHLLLSLTEPLEQLEHLDLRDNSFNAIFEWAEKNIRKICPALKTIKIDIEDYKEWQILVKAVPETVEIIVSAEKMLTLLKKIDDDENAILHEAAAEGDLIFFHTMMKCKVDWPKDSSNKFGSTPLWFACYYSQLELVKFLVAQGVDLHKKGKMNAIEELATPFQIACHRNQHEVINFLLQQKDILTSSDEDGNSCLHSAAIEGNLVFFENLTKCLPNWQRNLSNKFGSTPFWLACCYGHINLVKFLMEQGADVNITGKRNLNAIMCTPIQVAYEEKKEKVVNFLLQNEKVQLDITDSHKQTILDFVSKRMDLSFFKSLSKWRPGWYKKIGDREHSSPLWWAYYNGNIKLMQAFIEQGEDVNLKGQSQENSTVCTLVHMAYKEKKQDMLNFLLQQEKIQLDIADNDGNTVLHEAAEKGEMGFFEKLSNYGQIWPINVTNIHGATPFWLACYYSHVTLIKFLIAQGANQQLKTTLNKNEVPATGLQIAILENKDAVVSFFLQQEEIFNVLDEDHNTLLHRAAAQGDLVFFHALEKHCPNWPKDIRNKFGATPFWLACYYGHLEVLEFLLKQGADINIRGKDPLVGHELSPLEMVYIKTIRNYKKNLPIIAIDIDSDDGMDLINYPAAVKMPVDKVTEFLLKQPEIQFNAKLFDGGTLLHIAANVGHLAFFENLFEYKRLHENIDLKDESGRTPCWVACSNRHFELGQFLIEQGADINIKVKKAITLKSKKCELNTTIFDFAYILLKNPNQKMMDFLLQSHELQIETEIANGFTLLHIAAEKGDIVFFQWLLKKISNLTIDIADNDGITPLWMACYSQKLSMVKYLLEQGADINVKGKPFSWKHADCVPFACTPLWIACYDGRLELVQYLVEQKADVNVQGIYRNKKYDCILTPIQIAYEAKKTGIVDFLLTQENVRLDISGEDGETLLHCAARHGDLVFFQALPKYRPNWSKEITNKFGATLLWPAYYYGHIELMKYFIAEGFDTVQNQNNGTVCSLLHMAYKEKKEDVINSLLQFEKTRLDIEDNDGRTVLHEAAERGDIIFFKKLSTYRKSWPINLTNNYGATPLWCACNNGQLEMVKFLVEKGANLNVKGKIMLRPGDEGNICTPIETAYVNGHKDTVLFLLQQEKIRLDIMNDGGSTLLHTAAWRGDLSFFQLLSQYQIDWPKDLRNKFGDTVLLEACLIGHLDLVKFLVARGEDVNITVSAFCTPIRFAYRTKKFAVVNFMLQQEEVRLDISQHLKLDIKCDFREEYNHLYFYIENNEIYYWIRGFKDSIGLKLKNNDDEEIDNNLLSLLKEAIYKQDFKDITEKNKKEIFKITSKIGHNFNNGGGEGVTLLHEAVLNGDLDFFQALSQYRPNWSREITTEYGITPLWLACAIGHLELVKFFVIQCADLHKKGKPNVKGDLLTPFQIAYQLKKQNIVEFLSNVQSNSDHFDDDTLPKELKQLEEKVVERQMRLERQQEKLEEQLRELKQNWEIKKYELLRNQKKLKEERRWWLKHELQWQKEGRIQEEENRLNMLKERHGRLKILNDLKKIQEQVWRQERKELDKQAEEKMYFLKDKHLDEMKKKQQPLWLSRHKCYELNEQLYDQKKKLESLWKHTNLLNKGPEVKDLGGLFTVVSKIEKLNVQNKIETFKPEVASFNLFLSMIVFFAQNDFSSIQQQKDEQQLGTEAQQFKQNILQLAKSWDKKIQQLAGSWEQKIQQLTSSLIESEQDKLQLEKFWQRTEQEIESLTKSWKKKIKQLVNLGNEREQNALQLEYSWWEKIEQQQGLAETRKEKMQQLANLLEEFAEAILQWKQKMQQLQKWCEEELKQLANLWVYSSEEKKQQLVEELLEKQYQMQIEEHQMQCELYQIKTEKFLVSFQEKTQQIKEQHHEKERELEKHYLLQLERLFYKQMELEEERQELEKLCHERQQLTELLVKCKQGKRMIWTVMEQREYDKLQLEKLSQRDLSIGNSIPIKLGSIKIAYEFLSKVIQLGDMPLFEGFLKKMPYWPVDVCLNEDGATFLWLACKFNQPVFVKFLIEKGADVNANAKDWRTERSLLQIAYQNKNQGILELLLQQEKLDFGHIADEYGDTILHNAAKLGEISFFQLLTKHRPNWPKNITNKFGATPFWLACCYGHIDLVKFLIEQGTDMNLEGATDEKSVVCTPRHIANLNKKQDVVKFLMTPAEKLKKLKKRLSELEQERYKKVIKNERRKVYTEEKLSYCMKKEHMERERAWELEKNWELKLKELELEKLNEPKKILKQLWPQKCDELDKQAEKKISFLNNKALDELKKKQQPLWLCRHKCYELNEQLYTQKEKLERLWKYTELPNENTEVRTALNLEKSPSYLFTVSETEKSNDQKKTEIIKPRPDSCNLLLNIIFFFAQNDPQPIQQQRDEHQSGTEARQFKQDILQLAKSWEQKIQQLAGSWKQTMQQLTDWLKECEQDEIQLENFWKRTEEDTLILTKSWEEKIKQLANLGDECEQFAQRLENSWREKIERQQQLAKSQKEKMQQLATSREEFAQDIQQQKQKMQQLEKWCEEELKLLANLWVNCSEEKMQQRAEELHQEKKQELENQYQMQLKQHQFQLDQLVYEQTKYEKKILELKNLCQEEKKQYWMQHEQLVYKQTELARTGRMIENEFVQIEPVPGELSLTHVKYESSEITYEFLCELIQQGDISLFEEFFKEMPLAINKAVNKDGITPLWLACEYNHLAFVKSLIEQSADVNVKVKSYWRAEERSLLQLTYQNRNQDILEFLLQQETLDFDLIADEFRYAIWDNGNLSFLKLLAKYHPNWLKNITSKYGAMPLWRACKNGHLELVKFLIEQDADVNMKARDGEYFFLCAPVHIAYLAYWNQERYVVEFLLKQGKVYAMDENGALLLHYVAFKDDIIYFKRLLKKVPEWNIETANTYGATPLWFACYNDSLSMVKFLIEESADANVKGRISKEERICTPLEIAVEIKNISVVNFLRDIEEFRLEQPHEKNKKVKIELVPEPNQVIKIAEKISPRQSVTFFKPETLTKTDSESPEIEKPQKRSNEFISRHFKTLNGISESSNFLQDELIDEQLLCNGLYRGRATMQGNNCLLHSYYQSIVRFLKDKWQKGIDSFEEFVNYIRRQINRTDNEMLMINDEEQGVQILSAIKQYIADTTGLDIGFNLNFLIAIDNDIALIDNLEGFQKLFSEGELIVPVTIIQVNYNHYEPVSERPFVNENNTQGLESPRQFEISENMDEYTLEKEKKRKNIDNDSGPLKISGLLGVVGFHKSIKETGSTVDNMETVNAEKNICIELIEKYKNDIKLQETLMPAIKLARQTDMVFNLKVEGQNLKRGILIEAYLEHVSETDGLLPSAFYAAAEHARKLELQSDKMLYN